ncbi:MAG TPA: hypothetical protein VL793_15860 [Patescibacteria group bacterium]|nr:hypothetical protein [Patescibacteria group bacterium]
MQELPAQLAAGFEGRLDQAHVPQTLHVECHKWAGLYICFCQKLPANHTNRAGSFSDETGG